MVGHVKITVSGTYLMLQIAARIFGQMSPRTQPTTALDLTSTVVAEREQISAARFQHFVESLESEEWRLLKQHINFHGAAVT